MVGPGRRHVGDLGKEYLMLFLRPCTFAAGPRLLWSILSSDFDVHDHLIQPNSKSIEGCAESFDPQTLGGAVVSWGYIP